MIRRPPRSTRFRDTTLFRSAHILVGQREDCHARRRDLEALLAREYGISHTTLQVDHVGEHEGEMHGSRLDRKSTRLNSSHANISYAVFCLKKKKKTHLNFSY